ncbi:MAG: translation elongation factor Ts [Fusobacteriaceae bacterium]|jgi:elongation factor Ts|nr:translation elongation factor Ts [Fusobacteriaceae bacterium]
MAEITATLVKELRERTGAGMMDCKKALIENNGDMEKAIDFLREKGIAKAVKRGGKIAAEGLIFDAIAADNKEAVLVEFNSETDFVAKNSEFIAFGKKLAQTALEKKIDTVEALQQAEFEAGKSIETAKTDLIAKIGENMNIRRMAFVAAKEGFVVTYSHLGGKLGVIVELTGTPTPENIVIGRDIAMHVAAMDPRYLSKEQVTTADLEREKEIARKQLESEGKPANIIEKILIGKMNKFYEENCLLNQEFVKDKNLTVEKYAGSLKVLSFVRYKVGEGIEKKVEDFAAEVAAQIKG